MPTPAPALDRGLTVLERVLRGEGRGVAFGELAAALGISNASLSRLLQVLRAREYVIKDEATGRYRPGSRLTALGAGLPLVERLRLAARPLLVSLRKQTRNTVVLFQCNGAATLCVAKALHEESLGMQDEGTVRTDVLNYPWGWIMWAEADEDLRRAMLREQDTRAWLQDRTCDYREQGCTIDESSTIRRLAAPVFARGGELAACMVLGGNPLTIPDERVNAYAELLIAHAHVLSRALGGVEE